MEVRPGFKKTEVGAIPDIWEAGGLGRFWSVTDCKHVTAQFVAQGFPLASIREVQSRFVDLTSAKQTTAQFYNVLIEGGRKPRPGDLILSRNATVGEVAQVAQWHPPFAMGQDVCLLRKKASDQSTEFLQALFQSPVILNQLADLMVGSTFKRVNVQQIRNFAVPMPPPPEQRAIAAALSDVDALLEGLDRLIAKKRDLKQATMQQLLTGQTRLPGFHGEWEVVEFGDIVGIRNAKVVASSTPLGTQCVELDSIAGEGRGRLLVSNDAAGLSSKYSFMKGDVLFGRLRAYLRKYWLATFDGVCSTEIWPLVALDERVCGGFVHLLVQTDDFLNAAGVSYGTHMPRSDWSVLKKLIVRLPFVAERAAIAAVLSDMDAELSVLEVRRDKTRALKQGMMQELLTGRTRLVTPNEAKVEA